MKRARRVDPVDDLDDLKRRNRLQRHIEAIRNHGPSGKPDRKVIADRIAAYKLRYFHENGRFVSMMSTPVPPQAPQPEPEKAVRATDRNWYRDVFGRLSEKEAQRWANGSPAGTHVLYMHPSGASGAVFVPSGGIVGLREPGRTVVVLGRGMVAIASDEHVDAEVRWL